MTLEFIIQQAKNSSIIPFEVLNDTKLMNSLIFYLNSVNKTLNLTTSIIEYKTQITPNFVFTALILALIVILTIFGNILVLLAIFIDFHLRSPTHYLMGSLAMADLLLGTTVLPFSTVQQLLNYWPFGDVFCDIWLVTDVLCCTASIYLVLAISIDRYIGVTRPLRYNIIMTKQRVYLMIIFIWILSLIVSLTPFLGWKTPKTSTKICEVNDNIAYALFSTSMSFYIPLLIILIVYYRIYKEASRQSKFLKTGRKTSKMDNHDKGVTLRVHIGPTKESTLKQKIQYFNQICNDKDVLASNNHKMSLSRKTSRSSTTNYEGGSLADQSCSPIHSQPSNNTTNNNNILPQSLTQNDLLSSTSANGRRHHVISQRKKSSSTSGLPYVLSSKLAKFKREQKAAKTLAFVVGCFILCWMPFFIILPIVSFCKHCNTPELELLFKIFFWLGYCNSLMNPFIYAFSSREFRKAYKGILHCNLYYGTLSSTKAILNFHSTNTINDHNNNNNNNNNRSWNSSILGISAVQKLSITNSLLPSTTNEAARIVETNNN